MIDWKPVRIGDFLHRVKEPIKLSADENYNLVTVRMHHNGVVLRESKQGKLIGSNMYRVKPGQFILSGIDARHGAFGIIPEELDGAVVTNDFWYFDIDENVVSRDFFLWLTTTPLFLDACVKSSEGTTNRRRLQSEKFFNFKFHFPDIHEQHRLAEHFIAFDKTYSSLKCEFNRQCDYFKQLRQAVLQEAIEGKLTADWRRQYPLVKGDPQHDAAALLAQIKTEKERLVKEGQIRKEKSVPPITDDDKSFDLPDGWVWCRLGDVCRFITKGTTPAPNELKSEGEIPFLKVYNIINQKIDFYYKPQYISTKQHQKFERSRVFPGDVLMNIVGPPLGKIAIVPQAFAECNINQAIAIFSSPIKQVNEYLYLFLNEGSEIRKIQTLGVVGQDNISLTQCRDMLAPLPPLAEQQAIVTRIDSLMATIYELEKQVAERKDQMQILMHTVLREAFKGA